MSVLDEDDLRNSTMTQMTVLNKHPKQIKSGRQFHYNEEVRSFSNQIGESISKVESDSDVENTVRLTKQSKLYDS